jgi:hypothetical protein
MLAFFKDFRRLLKHSESKRVLTIGPAQKAAGAVFAGSYGRMLAQRLRPVQKCQGSLFQWKLQKRETSAKLEDLSATDQGRFELVEVLNKYRGQSGGESLPSGTLAVSEILEYEFGPGE